MAFPFYKQHDSMDCGPACLRMVGKYYGRDVSMQTLREKTQIGKTGVNMLGISQAAESVGFSTQCLQLSITSLLQAAKLPAILHWRQNHFVVLYKSGPKKFVVADPAVGVISISPEEFKSNWVIPASNEPEKGIALLLEPDNHFLPSENENSSELKGNKKKRIFSYLFPHRKLLFQLLTGLGIGMLFQLLLPFLTKSIVDTGIAGGDIGFITIILIAQLALFAGRLSVDFIRGWIMLHISTRINLSILNDFIHKLLKLPISFFDSKPAGDIMQRMNDHSRIESFLTGSSLNILFSMVNLVVFSIVLIIFNITIFTVFVIASILYSAWIIYFLRKRKKLEYERFDIASNDQGNLIQMVQGMQEIRLSGAQNRLRRKWELIQSGYFHLRTKRLKLDQWQQAGAFLITESKNILITFLSATAVIHGDLTLGSMIAIQYIMGQLNAPVEQIIGFAQNFQNAKISMDRLNEIHSIPDEEPEIKSLERIIHSENCPITLTNVSFAYPGAGNPYILNNINLRIPYGKTTAIVGTSGSGKTSLLKLLLRFYDPQEGEIQLGNVSFTSLSHEAWRQQCGVVMQESFIFSDTIAGNICLGDENPDPDRLDKAVITANAKEFIEKLPMKFQTKIGLNSVGISMGQKQRVLIARAVYKNPDFIFLDEATNSLDATNEQTILKNLEDFFVGRTVVVVAHRLSTVMHADQIVVLSKGRIVEKGTHAELAALKGEYYQLVKNQLELDK